MIAEFEWQISDPQYIGKVKVVWVRERMAGLESFNMFGPMPIEVANNFVKARRMFVDRSIKTKYQAMSIFQARPNLAALSAATTKLSHDVSEEDDVDDLPLPPPPLEH